MEQENENRAVEGKEKSCFSVMSEKSKQVWEKSKPTLVENQKTISIMLIAILLVAASIGFRQYQKKHDIGAVAAKAAVQKFVERNIQPGTKFEVKDAVKESGLYKVTVGVGSQNIDTFVSPDGKKLFTQAIDLTENQEAAEEETGKTEAENKSDIPEVKLFVMSFCPFGTQIEKGMIPVVNTLKDKIKFELEFVDYVMHGDKEITENLRQYCIQKLQPNKLTGYLDCFLKKGEGTAGACMKSAGINENQIGACFKETDAKFKVKENAADKSKWSNDQFPPFDVNKDDNEKYGVSGSPVLIVNGTEIKTGRDSASLLKAVCSGFSNKPEECNKELSSETPSSGFGEGTSSGGSPDASCGQ